MEGFGGREQPDEATRAEYKARADAAVASAGTVPEGLNPKQRKLFELRLKLNESRKAGPGKTCSESPSIHFQPSFLVLLLPSLRQKHHVGQVEQPQDLPLCRYP